MSVIFSCLAPGVGMRAKFEGAFNQVMNTYITQNQVKDRVAWSFSTDGKYSVESGYKFWQERYTDCTRVIQSSGWKKNWTTDLPHKIRLFLWRFCRNNVPVRNMLRSKGVNVTILCPLYETDVEHLLLVFFDCEFAVYFWNHMGSNFLMNDVESDPEWLLQKLRGRGKEGYGMHET